MTVNKQSCYRTGAAGGMGKAEAVLFAEEGTKVMATDIQESKLSVWVEEARKNGLDIQWHTHDVGDYDS